MSRSMLPEQTWRDLFALFDAVDGDGAALVRVARKSLPAHALGFVTGGVA